MKKTSRTTLVFTTALAVFAAAGIVAIAIPNCWEICTAGQCAFICSNDGGCAGFAQVCISGQGYCQVTCADGAVYNQICHLNCSGGGGGSPVFKKQPIDPVP